MPTDFGEGTPGEKTATIMAAMGADEHGYNDAYHTHLHFLLDDSESEHWTRLNTAVMVRSIRGGHSFPNDPHVLVPGAYWHYPISHYTNDRSATYRRVRDSGINVAEIVPCGNRACLRAMREHFYERRSDGLIRNSFTTIISHGFAPPPPLKRTNASYAL